MTNTVLIKRSATANSVPLAGNLSLGELALNYTDGNLFYKNSSNVVTVIASNKFLSVTGNVTAGNLSGTSIVGTLTTAAQTNITSVGTLGSLTVTGNTTSGNILTGGLISATGTVTGSQFNGSGAGLTSIPGANVTGTVPLATSATTAGTVTTAAQGNITSVGTLTSLNVTGNITGGNISVTSIVGTLTTAAQNNITSIGTLGSLSVTGNITGGNVLGGANVNATTHTGTTVSVSANITGGNLLTGGVISATANIIGGNLSGTSIVGTLTTAAQTNITSVGTLGSLAVTGNITSGNLSATGIAGTLSTAAQPNITSVSPVGLTVGDATQRILFSTNAQYSGPSLVPTGTANVLYLGPGGTKTTVGGNGSAYNGTLAVRQISGQPAFTVEDSTASTSWLYVDSSGNVGIGTSSPGYKLVIKQASGDLQFAMQGAVKNWNFRNQADGTFGYYDDSLGYWRYYYDTSNNHIWFNGASVERMRIDSSGNVGIGTTTLNGKLNVLTAADSKLVVNDGSTTGNVRLEAVNNTYTGYKPLEFNGSVQLFATGGTERMRIDSNGNLGIGTSSPVRKLTVSSAGACEFVLQDTSQAANSRNWRMFNTSNTLYFGTLNDAGTSGTDVMQLTSGADLQFNSGYGSVATAYGCRAWISFDANTATVRGSANISSITYIDVGRYNINFSTAMPDANYAVTTGVSKNGGGASGSNSVWASSAEGRSTGYFLIELWNLNNNYVNVSNVFAAVFR